MQMRTQRADSFAREAIDGVREVVLPVPGRKVRAHVGRNSDVLAHVEPIGSVFRKDAVRQLAGHAQGETAGAIRAVGITGRSVTRESPTGRCRRSVTWRSYQSLTTSSGLVASTSESLRN